jgi:hypothetical protein
MLQPEQWQSRLRPFYESGLRIIGEIPFSQADIEDMGESVHAVINAEGMTQGTRTLTTEYYYLFITLMAGFAAHNTEQNYWQAFADFLELEKQSLYNAGWHHWFVGLAKQHGLKVFSFEDDPTPYVTSIRYQGGIPAHSLPDYFERMVLPAVQRPELREVPPKKALDHLLQGHVYFVDSPVLDFLRNSGELGVEFFEKSCKLARHALQNHGAVLNAAEIDLPQYVVSAFEIYLEAEEDKKQHWRKPLLLASPYSDDAAVNLYLPEQEIGLDLFTHQMQWKVSWAGQETPIIIRSNLFHHRQSVVVKEDYLPIQATPKTISASFSSIDEETGIELELRRWNLPLVPADDQAPLLAFHDNGQQIPPGQILPSEPLYLITPIDSTIEFDGKGEQLEECPPLIGAWKTWKMTKWDLSQVWSLLLVKNSAPLGNVFPVQGVIAQPELVDGHLFQFQEYPDQPLYTSNLPSVRIPVASNRNDHVDLSNWQIHIRSLWDANPCIDKIIKVSEFEKSLINETDRVKFPLELLLGKSPAGIYEIKVKGPRDLGAEFRIRTWPKLMVLNHSMKLLSPSQAQQESVFVLILQENAHCEEQAGGESVKIFQNSADWEITAPPEANRVFLELTTPADNGGTVHVPISIPLPKLHWGMATEKAPGVLIWVQSLLHRSIDQLLQDGSSSLHIEMYGLGALIPYLRLQLVDLAENNLVIQNAKLSHTDFTKDWLRVTLGQFADSVKMVNSLAQFELVYQELQDWEEELHIPLLEVSRDLEMSEVNLEKAGKTSWKVVWHEDNPLKNRRFMILPTWQPWQKPWEAKIPDKSRGEFIIENSALPPSSYSLYFYIAPKWDEPRISPPTNIKPFVVNLCSAQDRIKAINRDGNSHNQYLMNSIELASIYDTLGDPAKRDEILTECAKELIHLTNLDLLIGFLKWIQTKEINPAIKSFFFNSMFHYKIVEVMLETYKGKPSILAEYLLYTAKVKMIPSDSAKLILNLVNDPVAVQSCLKSLLSKKENDLAFFVVTMMAQARLSKRDALELFSAAPDWALPKIAELDSNPYSDSLIAGLLPKIFYLNAMAEDTRVSDWMIRAIPYEEEGQVVLTYLNYLFEVEHTNRFNILMKSYLNEKIEDEEVMKLLSLEPKTALDILESAPDHVSHQKWIVKLIEKYPTAAGFVVPGDQLLTPFGTVKIDYIEKKIEGRVSRIRLGEQDYRLYVVAGDGAEKFRLQIDFGDKKIYIPGQTTVWKCGRCEYMNPEQNKVIHHADVEHRHVILSPLPLPISFTPEDIKIVIITNQ